LPSLLEQPDRLPKPFFFRTAWYVKYDNRRWYVCPGSPEERQRWQSGKRAKHFMASPTVEKIVGAMFNDSL
jgi:hypothetical protein